MSLPPGVFNDVVEAIGKYPLIDSIKLLHI